MLYDNSMFKCNILVKKKKVTKRKRLVFVTKNILFFITKL